MNNLQWKYLWVIVPSNYPCISEDFLKDEQKEMISNWIKIAKKIWFSEVIFSPEVIWNKKYNKATPEERISDFNYFLNDSNCWWIISFYWWETSVTINTYIDYNLCKNKKKFIMWFSDSAAFLNSIAYKSNIQVIYWIDFMWWFWKFLIENNELFKLYKWFLSKWNIKNLDLIPIQHDWTIISGKLFWWCLTSFNYTLWTGYNPIDWFDKDFILVIEDIWISFEKLIALLTQIKYQKNFKYCKWVIFWNFMNSSSKIIEKSIDDIIMEIFEWIPVFKCNDIWHGVYNYPTILGSYIVINSEWKKLKYI